MCDDTAKSVSERTSEHRVWRQMATEYQAHARWVEGECLFRSHRSRMMRNSREEAEYLNLRWEEALLLSEVFGLEPETGQTWPGGGRSTSDSPGA